MLQKDGSIHITAQDLLKGQALNPFIGFGRLTNLDLTSTPGVIKIQPKTVNNFSTASLPIVIVRGGGSTFVGCANGEVYKDGALLSDSTGKGILTDLLVVGDYLIIARNAALDLYGPFLTAPAYTANWKTGLATGIPHKMIYAPDKNAYITNGDRMAQLAISSMPTATLTSDSLILPSMQIAKTLALLGKFIMIGTVGGTANGSTGLLDLSLKVGNIYPWDYASGATYVEDPIQLNEIGVHQLFSHNNQLYAVAGLLGNVYHTDSVNYRRIKQIPYSYRKTLSDTVVFYPNAITFYDGQLLIGSSSGSSYDTTESRHGVYAIDLSEGFPIALRNGISTGNLGASQNLYIGVVASLGSSGLMIGWQDGSSYGVDALSSSLYPNFQASFETPLFTVGSTLNKKQYQFLEFTLGKALVSANTEQLKFQYRQTLAEDWQPFGSATGIFSASDITSISHHTKALLPELVTVQFKISLAQASGAESLQLLSLTIR